MKYYSLALLTFLVACGTAPHGYVASKSGSGSTSVIASTNSDSAPSSPLMTEDSAAATIEQAQQRMETAFPSQSFGQGSTATNSASFNDKVESGISQKLALLQNKEGKKLSPEQNAKITSAAMGVVIAAQGKNPFKTAQAWNGFVNTLDKMGREKANLNKANANLAAGGLIGVVVDLAGDLLKAAVDLVAAVLMLDIAGVINAVLDVVGAVVDAIV